MKLKLIELPQALTIADLNNCCGLGMKSLQNVCYHLLSGHFTAFLNLCLLCCVALVSSGQI
jgi:hypothetical protein